MLALISPAKKLDFKSEWNANMFSHPELLNHSQQLISKLKTFTPSNLQRLMKLSDKLVELNHQRYQRWLAPFTIDNARPAIYAFRGDTYVGLDADSLTQDDIGYAQAHLGILSGLYGLLKPCDLIQAYRLEMSTKLVTERGVNLYGFWGDALTEACNKAVNDHQDKTVISLASNEYIKAIRPKKLENGFITCHFKELRHDTPKTIGLFAKRARGMMARYIIQNRLETPESLMAFNDAGYLFIDALSDEANYVFVRQQP